MIVGVPREIKDNESRVAMTPAGAHALTRAGHTVLVENGAGEGSGFSNEEYIQTGASLVNSAAEVYGQADMILKVKEVLPPEYTLLRPGQVLFGYLHLAPDREQTEALLRQKVTGIAYETIETDCGLPLLRPMSEIAGRMAVQIGARILEKPCGGKGVLLGGVPGVSPAHVVIVGGGTVGLNAAKIACGMGARVTVLDKDLSRLRYLDDIFGGRVMTMMANQYNIAMAVREADLLIGAVLIPGAKAPRLVTAEMVREMQKGSVIVDVSIDQGGCIETIDRITTHSNPVYTCHGVIHYSVANMPGAVPRTSTLALTNATLPYALDLANKGWKQAAREDLALRKGINVCDGKITLKAVAEAMGLPFHPVEELL